MLNICSRSRHSYVDSQLKKSKRFDAEGIQNDYPELFAPYPRRRSSSSASVNTMSGFASDASGTASTRTSVSGHKRSEMGKEEGQLRYWTSEMCSSTPHLFDFVITVGGTEVHETDMWLTSACPARRRRHRPLHLVALPADCPAGASIRPRILGVPYQL